MPDLSPTSTRGAARTAAQLATALRDALAAACSEGADVETGKGVVTAVAPVGPVVGVGLSVTPGAVAAADVDLLDAEFGSDVDAERVTLRMPVLVQLTSYGLSGSGADDPFLDDVAEVSACLALLLRQPRSLTVGATRAVLVDVEPTGRAGITQDREGSDRYEASWSGTLVWTVAADRLPEELFVQADPFLNLDLGEPFAVEAATAL